MELPEVTKALNAWQEMRNYNAELLSEQSRLTAECDALKALNAELVASLSECLPWAQEYADEWNDENRVPMPSKQLARLERARTVLAKAKP